MFACFIRNNGMVALYSRKKGCNRPLTEAAGLHPEESGMQSYFSGLKPNEAVIAEVRPRILWVGPPNPVADSAHARRPRDYVNHRQVGRSKNKCRSFIASSPAARSFSPTTLLVKATSQASRRSSSRKSLALMADKHTHLNSPYHLLFPNQLSFHEPWLQQHTSVGSLSLQPLFACFRAQTHFQSNTITQKSFLIYSPVVFPSSLGIIFTTWSWTE